MRTGLLLIFTLGSPQPGTVDGLPVTEAAAALREVLLSAMPAKLHESTFGWGHTTPVRTLKWRGRGLKSYAELVDVQKNDGAWRKIAVTPRDPRSSLVLNLANVRFPDPDRILVDVFVAMDVNVEIENQLWESGVRIYSGSTRARLRGQVRAQAEATVRVVSNGTWLPDLVFRLRLLQSNVAYDNLVVEHIAGIGGTGARLTGEALRGTLKQLHPSLERDLLQRINTALLRAADTLEIRIALSSLLKLKKT